MILITGGTGKTGGETARQLAAAGHAFRALVRDAGRAKELQALGAELVVGDIGDRQVLDEAFRGVERTLLIMPNGEQQQALECQFVDAAEAAGVKHIVYLSSIESVPENKNPITQMHVAVEKHIRKSAMDWTLIRPSFFMQIFLTQAPRVREHDQIVFPAGQGTIATTDLRDVGAVMVKALTESGHANQSYDISGPELLTLAECAERFSQVLGRKITYVDQPMAEFADRLRAIGIAEWRVLAVCKEFEGIASGLIDHTTETAEQLLGRPPCSLAQFIDDHRAAFMP